MINYPNSPTGRVATTDFYRRVVDFAHDNQIVVVQNAHIMLSYDGAPLSFLSVPGARDVGVEVHSMSKGFHMIGWLMGFVAGHRTLCGRLVMSRTTRTPDSLSPFKNRPPPPWMMTAYLRPYALNIRRRLAKLVEMLGECGFQTKLPGGTYFLYTPAPQHRGGPTFENAEQASQYLITEHSIVTVPWDDAGSFLRFSGTYVRRKTKPPKTH